MSIAEHDCPYCGAVAGDRHGPTCVDAGECPSCNALRAEVKVAQRCRASAENSIKEVRQMAMAAEARAARMEGALQGLKSWRTPAVLGEGDYHKGLLCGLEDQSLQRDGYAAMRYGYDRAIERVAEEIDDTIDAALSAPPAETPKEGRP